MGKREDAAVVATAQKLKKFYPHLVRWDVTRSNSVCGLCVLMLCRCKCKSTYIHMHTYMYICVHAVPAWDSDVATFLMRDLLAGNHCSQHGRDLPSVSGDLLTAY